MSANDRSLAHRAELAQPASSRSRSPSSWHPHPARATNPSSVTSATAATEGGAAPAAKAAEAAADAADAAAADAADAK